MNEFHNKKVLITGGTKGLGFAIASAFSQQQAEVFLTYRSDEETAQNAHRQIVDAGGKCTIFKCDLAFPNASEKLFAQIKEHTQTLDFYIHNAAATAFKNLLQMKEHHIDKTFNITVKSFILNMKHVVEMMSGGAVVTISGMDTLKAVPFHGLLAAAKSSLETLTAYYAHEVAAKNIAVNGINPGFFRTESTQKYLGKMFEKVNNQVCNAVPLKREATLQEISELVLFLCSRKASWIVGQTIKVDGGLDFAPNFQV
ncbi:SDR family NAD(P)-dependent oxidoreductase [Candidatus Uabimicrobium amorphum]|uniref:Beta-ketoacyl-ACP reductase n=1 Tax=Uabimicrobium amorphum TaxID=2596890 RepID=A0A5S9IJ07_UABAM|nr:SDR family oxidoreductase [Candidatus Uabimicrobium amorphum]BBM82769.1 beta-ketoacyl-ACP reductase [Candidatus Uabimicrobium amorphum]